MLCIVAVTPATTVAQEPADTLALQKVENVEVWREYDASRNQFLVWVRWDDIPDSLGTLIHQPDTVGWALTTDPSLVSQPTTGGFYQGDIDRTVSFRSTTGGVVGQDSLLIRYEIRREEEWSGEIDVGSGYTPGTWIDLPFRNAQRQTLDLGLQISFTAGVVDAQGQFVVGLEDFEGFHLWRGIERDGSDLEVIGELSKEEAFFGGRPGGSEVDSIYFYEVIPALRTAGVYRSPESIDCIGFTINQPLEDNELIWFDCNAFNGFTYYYMVTTFDRGYSVRSGRQGLNKIDRCQPTLGVPLADSCVAELVPIQIQVDPQNNLSAVYAVPNPYRTGGSRLTTENYHNFPDDKIRFVNVPTDCQIKIFTVSGDLVWEYTHNGGGNIEWDATNRGGESVTSGVYIFRVEDPGGGQVYGRLIVIR
jgi:hypothetical protein